MTTGGASRRGVLDRPLLDWLIATVLVVPLVLFTPLVALFVGAEADGQRGAMSSISSLLANVAAFGVAALFAYSALENATTRRMRARRGPHLTGVFLRSLGVIFFSVTVLGFVKLLRLLLVVAALLKGQHADARREAQAAPEVRGSGQCGQGQSA